jgi:hypothetical protein
VVPRGIFSCGLPDWGTWGVTGPALPSLRRARRRAGALGRAGLLLRLRAQAEVVEDAPDGDGVGDKGDDAQALSAAGAAERIHLADLGDEPRPACGAASLRRVAREPSRFELCLVRP